jgi:hypothetical protein
MRRLKDEARRKAFMQRAILDTVSNADEINDGGSDVYQQSQSE